MANHRHFDTLSRMRSEFLGDITREELDALNAGIGAIALLADISQQAWRDGHGGWVLTSELHDRIEKLLAEGKEQAP